MSTINTNSSNRTYTINGVTNDQIYRVRVAAVNSYGQGPFTQYINVTPSLFALDTNYYNVELLMDMDNIANSDPYYGNTVFALNSTDLGVNDDPYYLETKLLLHGNNLALIDSSLSSKGVGRSSNTSVYTTTTTDGYFGSGSILFNGDNWLSFGSSEDFSVGTGDFTIECFVKFLALNNNNPICNPTVDNGADSGKWYWNYSNGSLMLGRHNTGDIASVSWSPSTGVWYHIAVVRASGTIKMYVDGIEQSVTNNSIFNNVSFNQNGFNIGRVASMSPLNGQVDEFRFTKGVARTISLPSSPYPNPKYVFQDVSPNPKPIILVGEPSAVNYTNIPTAPSNLMALEAEGGGLLLQWDPYTTPPAIVSYSIEYSTDGGVVWTPVVNASVDTNSATINNLSDGFYIFRVSSNNGIGQSSWSTVDVQLPLTTTAVEYLVVAGGGGGGNDMGGGGGGGGVRSNVDGEMSGGGSTQEPILLLDNGATYTITVGAGGSGAAAGTGGSGTNGGNSAILKADSTSLVSSLGGGYGASKHNGNEWNANNGGCGGGGSGGRQSSSSYGGLPGNGTAKQGFNGATSGYTWYPGGGGGAGGAGFGGGSSRGHGGPGVLNRILGTVYYWAGGGGGSGYSTTGGDGGIGGGGGGAVNTTYGGAGLNNGSGGGGGSTNSQTNTPGGNAGANTGGGGGGGSHYNSNNYGGSGGAGVVILRSRKTAASTTGSPTVTTSNGYNIYMFTGAGSISFAGSNNALPPAPKNIVASRNQNSDQILQWDASPESFNVTSYNIQYKLITDTTWTTLNSSVSSNSTIIDSNLSDGDYIFRVAAINSYGQGGWKAKNVTLPLPFSVSLEYLVVAGGGGGGQAGDGGGGGGAGGLLTGTTEKLVGNSILLTIGTGGSQGVSGTNSVLDTLVAIGGGAGANNAGPKNAFSGGSGGGQGRDGCGTAGSGTTGQGNRGGNTDCGGCHSAGGGGGAGEVGYDGAGNDCSAIYGNTSKGGDGLSSSITGTLTYYAGGGGGGYGGGRYDNAAKGGLGGGGDGGGNTGYNGVNNTGGGGGGGRYSYGGSGGSGVVIIAYEGQPISNIDSGLTYTLDTTSRPGFNIYKFTSGSGYITF